MNVGGFGNGVVFFFTFALFVFLPPSCVCVCLFRKKGRREEQMEFVGRIDYQLAEACFLALRFGLLMVCILPV